MNGLQKKFSRHLDGHFSLFKIILNNLHKHSCSLCVACFRILLLILSSLELVLFFRVFVADCNSHILFDDLLC